MLSGCLSVLFDLNAAPRVVGEENQADGLACGAGDLLGWVVNSGRCYSEWTSTVWLQ